MNRIEVHRLNSPFFRSPLALGCSVLAVHSIVVPLMIILRSRFWSTWGSQIGELHRLIDFPVVGLVHWTLNGHHEFWVDLGVELGIGVGTYTIALEIFFFVLYGGIFWAGFVSLVAVIIHHKRASRAPGASE